MAKKLSDVLAGTNKSRTRPGSTGTRPGLDYASKMKDERDFVASHEVQEFDDRVGNGSDVYNASNIKHNPDDRHGHLPKPEDEKQYKQANEEAMTSSPRPVFAEAKKEYEEDATDEKEMMLNQLNFIKLASEKIKGHINSTKDPEEWFQNKLSGLHANMKDLHAYVAGEKGEVKEEAEQIDELDKKTYGSYAKKAKDDLGKRESEITRNMFVDPKGVKDPIKHNNSLLMKRAKRRDYINTAIDKLTKEEVELDEISNDLKKSYLAKAKDDVADRKMTISQANKMKNASRRNFHSHSLWMDVAFRNQDKNDSRKAMMAKAKDSMKKNPVQEEAEGDPRVEPKDVKNKGKSLKLIIGQVKESKDGSRTKTGTEQARARFDKKMERKEIMKMQKDQEDDN